MTAAVVADRDESGRTRITSRAVRRIVSAVTAEALNVSASDVSVELNDDGGSLAVIARSPIHVSPLGLGASRTTGRAGMPGSTGTLLQRLETAQASIRTRCLQLTGSTVTRVDLRITGADLIERRRVS